MRAGEEGRKIVALSVTLLLGQRQIADWAAEEAWLGIILPLILAQRPHFFFHGFTARANICFQSLVCSSGVTRVTRYIVVCLRQFECVPKKFLYAVVLSQASPSAFSHLRFTLMQLLQTTPSALGSKLVDHKVQYRATMRRRSHKGVDRASTCWGTVAFYDIRFSLLSTSLGLRHQRPGAHPRHRYQSNLTNNPFQLPFEHHQSI